MADVTDDAAVAALAARLDRVDVLVNNAGGARGLEPVADADIDHWRWMWESNVLGTLRVTRALLPKLIDSGDGLIVTVTPSRPSRSTTAAPVTRRPNTRRARCTARCAASCSESRCGSPRLHRHGRRPTSRCAASTATRSAPTPVYKGVTPLVAEDIAEVIGFVASDRRTSTST